MSDLISRLAARVVGSAASSALPRPVQRFGEERGSSTEVAEKADTEPAPPLMVPEDTVLPGHADASLELPPAGEVAGHQGPRPTRGGASGREAVSVFRGEPPDGLGDRSTIASVEIEPEREGPPSSGQPGTSGGNRPRGSDEASARTTDRGSRPLHAVVAAVASPPGQPPSSPPAPAWPRPTVAAPQRPRDRSDGPVVDVHIGRLDVRAVPEPAVAQRHRPEPPKPGLSLADYLRGQREEP